MKQLTEAQLRKLLEEAFEAGVEAQVYEVDGLTFPVEKDKRDEYVDSVMGSV